MPFSLDHFPSFFRYAYSVCMLLYVMLIFVQLNVVLFSVAHFEEQYELRTYIVGDKNSNNMET